MRYYFNTPDQISGDEAFNEQRYTEALAHYKHALQTLNQLASQRNFKRSSNFLYAFTYVVSEVIITDYEAIRTTINNQENFNFDPIYELWKEIPGLIIELETVFAEMDSKKDKERIKDKIQRCYSLLADVCDMISEEASDELDETSNINDILAALKWLTKSINYSKRANLSISIDSHFGYLNLLEQAYKRSLEKNFLVKISQYINDNELLSFPFTSMQALEILSYQLLVAVENNDSHTASQFIAKFRELITNPDVNQDHSIVEDIQTLITKLPSNQETFPSKKRKIKENKEAISNNDEAVSNKEEEAANTMIQLSKKSKTYTLENATDEKMSDASTAPTNTPPVIKSNSYPKALPSISQHINTTFFANNSDSLKKVKFQEVAHSSAFVKTFNQLSEKASNPEFLANILSLMADFYGETGLSFKNKPLLAFELYENALLLSSRHPVAMEKMKNISNHPIIRDNNRYGSKSTPTKDNNTITIFTDAIENLIIQIDAFAFQNVKEINKILDSTIVSITNKIVNKNIAGSRSSEIAALIKTQYDFFSTHERNTEQSYSNMMP